MAAKSGRGSRIFCPFRALGFVSNHVPLVTQTLGPETFVVTAVGSAFHLYNCSKLKLLFVGLLQEDEITCLATFGEMVVTASGNRVILWKRGKQFRVFTGHTSSVQILMSFGPHIISVDENSNVKVWVGKTAEVYLDMEFDPATFGITCMMHPSTYLNKVLLCSRQGSMQLWNVKTNKLVYTFEGWSNPITAVEQAPAVDVVAVGLQSGKIVIHNLKYDETVMSFQQDWGPVSCLAFRTDGNPIMATSSPAGHIALWDLEERQLRCAVRDAHSGGVCGMKFLQSQPLMVTSGPDNTLKVWIFDQPDGSARLLRSRSGHSAPPTMVRFYGSRGQAILSAGLDRTLRYLCTTRDAQSCELSQGSLAKKSKNLGVKIEQLKLPPITDFAAEENRQSEWDSVITCHQGHTEARTWNFRRKCIGQHALKPAKTDGKAGAVTAVTLSSCGNFAISGDSFGSVHIFHMQSGIHRDSIGKPKAHDGCVRGVAIDALNQHVLTAGADGKLKFWLFNSRRLLTTLTHDTPIIQILLHRESGLVAVSCEDFIVYVVDMEMRRIVRKFAGHSNRVTDMAFSPDARWLITSSMDSTVRTWDLPAARLLDCFLVESPVTTLAMSPLGDFLATCHVDDLGVHLWSNKALYGQVSLVALPSDYQPSLVQMPATSSGQDNESGDEEEVPAGGEGGVESVPAGDEVQSPEQLSAHLITLSMLPESRWRNLTNLDLIKKRNKPKEPPKAPKAAPFFLPTEPGLVPKFVPAAEDLPEVPQSKLLQLKSLQPESDFQKALHRSAGSSEYGAVLEMLKSMGPSAIDAEIRSLAPEAGGDLQLMKNFLDFVEAQLVTKKDFELVEAYLALFLKVHGPTIAKDEELTEAAGRVQTQHDVAWTQLQDLMNQCACLVGYFKSAVI